MSGKIRSKDLAYESALPPFLQRLRAQNVGGGDADRHERPLARPRRTKDPAEDDGPTMIDESGDLITKEGLENRLSQQANNKIGEDTSSSADPKHTDELVTNAPVKKRVDQKVTDGTSSKKRKVAVAVGKDATDDDEDRLPIDPPPKHTVRKPKKKAKPIKLAFDEDEGS